MDSVLYAQGAEGKPSQPSAFAYFYDPEDVARSIKEWPECVRVVVCLAADGVCDFLLFHEEEEDRIMPRICRVLRRNPGHFATSPVVDGYPEKRLLFSEETTLINALKADDGMLERAQDYAVNYRFARDEGLDPENLCDPGQSSGGSQERLARRSVAKIFPMTQKRSRRELPGGYHRVDPAKLVEFDAELRLVGGRLRLARPGDDGVPIYSAEVSMRDDLSAFHLPADVLGRSGCDGLPLDMPVEIFPSVFRQQESMSVKVTMLPSGVFVHRLPDQPIVPPAPSVEPEPVRAGARIAQALSSEWIARGLRVPALAVVSLVATGFFSAMVAETLADDNGRWLWSSGAPSLSVFDAKIPQK